jgi:LuxR family transcriptional regulator, maltose regulon positive regulatory protein
VVDSPVCHRTLEFFVDHLPATVHLLLATRVDPPLPLARMRARGELVEIRAAELCFTPDEASALLHATTDRRLAPKEVRRLTERTEGWAAALHLAGLSLRGRPDADDFLASFHGGHRLVADYLGDEVLAGQSDAIRAFLVRTSILERLSAPLCDAILEAGNSAELLAELEQANLFLVPLDDRREWYRYHYLFVQLLRLELADRHPDLATVLHRRAASWHRAAGHPEEAIHHATAAGDLSEAGDLIAQHWIGYWHRGHTATVLRWLGRLPERQLATQPSLAMVAAFVGAFHGAPAGETERLLALADAGGDAPSMVPGSSSLAAVLALVRATQLFGDVGRCVAAARRALAGAAPSTPFAWMAVGALGQALYLSGSRDEPRLALADLLARVSAAEQPYAVMVALGVLSLIAGDGGDAAAARALAERAATTAETLGIGQVPVCGPAFLAAGRALAANGELEPAERRLRQAMELFSIDSTRIWRAHALLALASVRQARGDHQDAERLVNQARGLIGQFTDPGMLPALLRQAEEGLGSAPPPRVALVAPLTERELTVLRQLPTQLRTPEIARELSVSVNTIRSQVQAIYRKLQVTSRAEAIAQARHLRLLPQPRLAGSPPAPQPPHRPASA